MRTDETIHVEGTPYRLVARAGQGGVGDIWEVTDLAGVPWALKSIEIEGARAEDDDIDPDFEPENVETRRLRCLREAQIPRQVRARTHCQHVVEIQHAGWDDPQAKRRYFIVMRPFHEDLADWREGLAGIDLQDLLRVAVQAAEAIQRTHDQGFVHRDVKPANFLRTGSESIHVVLADYGIAGPIEGSARAADDPRPGTKAGAWLMDPDWASPEAFQGAEFVDQRSDWWGLGATLLYLWAGSYDQDERKVPVELICDDLARELATLIEGLLHREPDQRPSVPHEQLSALMARARNAAAGGLPADSGARPEAELPPPPPRRPSWPLVALALALVGLGVIAGALVASDSSGPPSPVGRVDPPKPDAREPPTDNGADVPRVSTSDQGSAALPAEVATTFEPDTVAGQADVRETSGPEPKDAHGVEPAPVPPSPPGPSPDPRASLRRKLAAAETALSKARTKAAAVRSAAAQTAATDKALKRAQSRLAAAEQAAKERLEARSGPSVGQLEKLIQRLDKEEKELRQAYRDAMTGKVAMTMGERDALFDRAKKKAKKRAAVEEERDRLLLKGGGGPPSKREIAADPQVRATKQAEQTAVQALEEASRSETKARRQAPSARRLEELEKVRDRLKAALGEAGG